MNEDDVRERIEWILSSVGTRGWKETSDLIMSIIRTEVSAGELRGFDKATVAAGFEVKK